MNLNDPYILTAVILIPIFLTIIIYMIFFMHKPAHHNYCTDNLYGANWKWEWKKENILNLSCYCPECDEKLVYENDHILHKTYFLCSKCNSQKAVIGGGDSKYALSVVLREILRKVRTKEYQK